MRLSNARRRGAAALLALVATMAATACDSPLSERTIDTNIAGRALFALFLDNNLNGTFDQFDTIIPEGEIVVRRVGVAADSSRFFTDETGIVLTGTLGIGRYQAFVGATVRGDTLTSAVDSVVFNVFAQDTTPVALGLQYPELEVGEYRDLPTGRKAWIHGVVLNNPGTFGDSTMHVADSTAAIRAINLRFNIPVSPGDTIDLLGTRRARGGQPAIDPLIAIPRGGGLNPPPIEVETAAAATADDAALDAAFVVVRNAEVIDTTTTFTARLLTVDDGSGPLVVSLHPGINPALLNVPGVRLDVSGLLVPDPTTETWILKPRMRADILIRLPIP